MTMLMKRCRGGWALPFLLWPIVAPSPAVAADPCREIMPARSAPTGKQRMATPADLARLRDIGPSVGAGLPDSPLALSPDKRQLAFVLSRGDPQANDYCQALIVMEVRPGAELRLLDTGRGIIPNRSWLRGVRNESGSTIVNTPQWSPDGKLIAYLRIEGETVQARIVSPTGSTAITATRSQSDVRKIAWSGEGRLLFANEAGIISAVKALQEQDRAGYLYDEHFVPNASARPSIAGPLPYAFHSVAPWVGDERPATAAEEETLSGTGKAPWARAALLSAEGPSGWRAWTARRDANPYISKIDLFTQRPDEAAVRCMESPCTSAARGIEGLWWSPSGSALIFLRRGGWADSREMLFRWQAGKPVKEVLSTDDLLTGCHLVREQLLCARESSSRPRRLVLIDTITGSEIELFDPNPEFKALRFGRVERVHWKTPTGTECFGDLVLPADYDGKRPLPTVTVQYLTRGFLRGGVGDEYPIFALAARGLAVFSFHRPPDYYETVKDGTLRSFMDAQRANTKDWNDRRSVNAALMAGLDLLVERRIADPSRLGITGLSDGATTTQFALINGPHRFAAAAVSTGFMEPVSTQIFGGSAWARQLQDFGYPPLDKDQAAFWKQMSVGLNAPAIDAPILMQVADEEYLTALEAHAMLQAFGKPTEMVVFAGEHHVKQQPAHRLAIYERVIDWFGFWLLNVTDGGAEKAPQYARWRKLRADQSRAGGLPSRDATQASTSTSDNRR